MKEPLKKIPGIVLGFLLTGTATSADMVLTNGQIYTVDDSQPWAEAVAIENGRFEYVGDADGAKAFIDSDTVEYDLQGRFVLPGLVDSHTHPGLVARSVEVTACFPLAHGAPIHVGEPEALGITDLGRPHFGDAVSIRSGEIPVFWACGVTPQAVAMHAKPEFMITHAPGHMFLTDLRDDELSHSFM